MTLRRAGQVILYVAYDKASSPPNGIPSDSAIQDIGDLLANRGPLMTRLTVLPVEAITVNITVANVVPDSEALRTVLESAITAYFAATQQVGGTLYLHELRGILRVAGLVSADLTAPTANVDLGLRGIPVLGTLSVS